MDTINVTVTPEQAANDTLFLLATYKPDTHQLIDLNVVNRGAVPTSTDEKEFDLIEVDGVVMALPDIVTKYCTGYDGKGPITLQFNREGATFYNWFPASAAASAA